MAALLLFPSISPAQPNPFSLAIEIEDTADGEVNGMHAIEADLPLAEAVAAPGPASAPATGALAGVGAQDAPGEEDAALAARCAKLGVQLAAQGDSTAARAAVHAAIAELCALRDAGQLHAALPLVAFAPVGDDALRVAFEALVTPQLSYACCAALVERALAPRALALEQPASRALFATIELTLARHPKAVVDGLLVPTFAHERIGPAQSEVVCRLLRDAVKPPFVELFLHAVADERSAPSGCWGEQQVTILQQAVNRKVSPSPALVLALLEQAAASSERLKRSLKFAKLLLVLVQRFGACGSLC